MNDTMTTTEDIVKAAASVARDAAEGRLSPGTMEQQLVTELRELVGVVVGPDDPLWGLQIEVARGVLAAGGIGHQEVSEWAAVLRRRAGEASDAPEPVSQPGPDDAPPTPISPASRPHGPVSEAVVAIIEVAAAPESATDPAPPVVRLPRPAEGGGYDPLAGWKPGGTRR